MPLDLSNTISYYDWCRLRETQKAKWVNVPYLKKFNKAISCLANNYHGEVVYYTNKSKNLRYMSYGEGTPLFYFFKLVPEDYLIRRFNIKPYWLSYTTNHSTIEYLHSLSWSKYPLSDNIYVPATPYVLVVLNEMSTEKHLINYMNAWAEHNKYRVVFKAHPFPTDSSDPLIEWDKIINKSKYCEFCIDVNTNSLVDYCSAMISIESGIGLYALLKDKPVTYFKNNIDYSYGLIANFCNNVTELDSVIFTKLPRSDIYQYISWFYNTSIIDVSTNFDNTLYARFDKYFNRKYTVDEYFTI